MAISKNSVRVFVTIPKKLYEECKTAADKETRTFSNYVAVALKEKLERDK